VGSDAVRIWGYSAWITPDILEFITAKNDITQLTNFNISVAVTEEFMDALKDDGEYELINPPQRRGLAESFGPGMSLTS